MPFVPVRRDKQTWNPGGYTPHDDHGPHTSRRPAGDADATGGRVLGLIADRRTPQPAAVVAVPGEDRTLETV